MFFPEDGSFRFGGNGLCRDSSGSQFSEIYFSDQNAVPISCATKCYETGVAANEAIGFNFLDTEGCAYLYDPDTTFEPLNGGTLTEYTGIPPIDFADWQNGAICYIKNEPISPIVFIKRN